MATTGKVMIEDELHEEEAQSLRELVEEEVVMAIFRKTKKKKMKGKGEAKLSKMLTQFYLFYFIAQNKGWIEANVSSFVKGLPQH